MKKTVKLLGVVVAVLMFSAIAKADQIVFTATLTGSQEVPPNASPGIGSALVTLDTVANTLTVNVAFAGLVSPTTIAHIHCCAPPGGIAIPATTVPSFPGFPTGVTTGTFITTLDLTLASSFNPAFIAANGGTVAGAQAAFIAGLLNGQAYFNIHTVQFPQGEIRGQLQEIPEPASLLLLATGILGIGGALRKRRKRG
ncbi:MAG TPA: CHRD domain-containing protein [Pyrinomonadaceae bacterium]|nr:CHRD domain-containing protein [Pyrinomonadaceae bacterium]